MGLVVDLSESDGLLDARRRTLAGQPHNVDPAVIAPALAEFFKS